MVVVAVAKATAMAVEVEEATEVAEDTVAFAAADTMIAVAVAEGMVGDTNLLLMSV